MHHTALEYAKAFFDTYVNVNEKKLKIVEIGSLDVNGSIRSYAPLSSEYTGLDFTAGKSVDIVLKDAYHFPLPDNYADAVVTSSCFEHSQFFWLSFMEGLRILKPSGVMYVNAPSNGWYHTYPTDNWRFYPDASKALADYANTQGIKVAVLESFIGSKSPDGGFKDFVAVFVKDKQYANLYQNRIYNTVQKELEPTNVWLYGNEKIINYTSDMAQDKFETTLRQDSFYKKLKHESLFMPSILMFCIILCGIAAILAKRKRK